ncbi:ArnT family glycosyltransferase [Achromobacter aloeverae]
MRISTRTFFLLLAVIVVTRLLAMAVVPLADTSEPRYAETARLMVVTDNWITPWFEPGVPFWGKPPLAFWAQAAGMVAMGSSEFAVRFPSFLAMALVAMLLYAVAKIVFGSLTARWSTLVLASMLLPLLSAGAVLTDPFLALGTTLSMLSLLAVQQRPTGFWRYGFFLGLAIGLLAKGPLALVLVAGSCAAWMFCAPGGRRVLRGLPWSTGILLVIALAVPWYVAAELRTHGFLRYFLVGEHFLRFVDPGWAGDRYGSAHARPLGSIWLDWIAAAAPWSLVCLAGLAGMLMRRRIRSSALVALRNPSAQLLLAWALSAPVLFTASGNILWTYVLPSLPPVALGLGWWLAGTSTRVADRRRTTAAMVAVLLIPIASVVLSAQGSANEKRFKTEKILIETADRLRGPNEPVYFVGSPPFSARFYSRGMAQSLPWKSSEFPSANAEGRILVAVPRGKSWPLISQPGISAQVRYSSRRYTLYEVTQQR